MSIIESMSLSSFEFKNIETVIFFWPKAIKLFVHIMKISFHMHTSTMKYQANQLIKTNKLIMSPQKYVAR